MSLSNGTGRGRYWAACSSLCLWPVHPLLLQVVPAIIPSLFSVFKSPSLLAASTPHLLKFLQSQNKTDILPSILYPLQTISDLLSPDMGILQRILHICSLYFSIFSIQFSQVSALEYSTETTLLKPPWQSSLGKSCPRAKFKTLKLSAYFISVQYLMLLSPSSFKPSHFVSKFLMILHFPGSLFSYCSVLFYVMVSQGWPQKEIQERLRKTKFITLTGPGDRKHNTPRRATWERHQGGQRQNTEQGESVRPEPLLEFH